VPTNSCDQPHHRKPEAKHGRSLFPLL
jgi:hypothetical protein